MTSKYIINIQIGLNMSLIISSTGLAKFVAFLAEQKNISGRGVEACANATGHPRQNSFCPFFS